MEYTFRNKSKDLTALIEINKEFNFEIEPGSEYILETSYKNIQFSVKYFRDFSFGLKDNFIKGDTYKDRALNKVFNKCFVSVGNLIIQTLNLYEISGKKDGTIIDVKDSTYLIPQTSVSEHYKCLPVIYYFGRAEGLNCGIKFIGLKVLNRVNYIDLYSYIYKAFNLKGIFFRAIRYSFQVSRHKKYSATKKANDLFKKLYRLRISDRDDRLRPVYAVLKKFVLDLKNVLSIKTYNKLIIFIESKTGYKITI